MKKLLLTVTAAAVVFATTAAAWANEEIRVYLDGQQMSLDVQPQIIEDRTFVPMRAIFENFGMEVKWDGNTQTVTATGNGNEISMTVGNMSFSRNDEEIILDVPAQIVEDRTLVPVRAISESLDCFVKWDGDDRKVSIISSPDKIIGTATVENMRCLIDYQPIEFVNIDGYTYLKATDLDKYGFDVTEENGDIYIKRNKNELPLLIEEYKDKLIKDIYKTNQITVLKIQDMWKEPLIGKTFDIFNERKNIYLDDEKVSCCNIGGELYICADELKKYGIVEWIDKKTSVISFNEDKILSILLASKDLDAIDTYRLFPDDYNGYGTYEHAEHNGVIYGLCQYENGKRNGFGYRAVYHMAVPSDIYEAGEYEDGKLKNGVYISNDDNYTAVIYEVKDFVKTQLYPKE